MNSTSILIWQDNQEQVVDEHTVLSQSGADAMIRIQTEDYRCLPPTQDRLNHFNLPNSKHHLGFKYILPRIIRKGYKTEQEEVLPLLDFQGSRLGECTKYISHISYEDLQKSHFRFSFTHIKNQEELLRAMINRYRHSRPYLSEKDIEQMGVSFTEITFINLEGKE